MRYLICAFAWAVVFACAAARADDRVTCPSPDPCKVVVITNQEEKILLDERGILATAAQARSLDLGVLVAYFQQKIAKAPAGDKPPQPEQKDTAKEEPKK